MTTGYSMPMPAVTRDKKNPIIRLSFADGRFASIDGDTSCTDRYIEDWTTSSNRCYMRGVQDGLKTDDDFIKYVYDNWVSSCISRLETAYSHVRFMDQYKDTTK